jgi:hypothetical protein
MIIKTIEINGDTFSGLGCINAAEYHEQHEQFAKLFEAAPPETQAKWRESETFADPTLKCTPEELEDSFDNFILFPSDFVNKMNADPESNYDTEVVFLLKPSGIFKTTYKEALSLSFPRNTTNLEKTDLDPKVFINALKDVK